MTKKRQWQVLAQERLDNDDVDRSILYRLYSEKVIEDFTIPSLTIAWRTDFENVLPSEEKRYLVRTSRHGIQIAQFYTDYNPEGPKWHSEWLTKDEEHPIFTVTGFVELPE